MSVEANEQELWGLLENALNEKRNLTLDEQNHFDKLFERTINEME